MVCSSEDSIVEQRGQGGMRPRGLKKAVAVSDASMCWTAEPCPRVEICRPALHIHTAMAA